MLVTIYNPSFFHTLFNFTLVYSFSNFPINTIQCACRVFGLRVFTCIRGKHLQFADTTLSRKYDKPRVFVRNAPRAQYRENAWGGGLFFSTTTSETTTNLTGGARSRSYRGRRSTWSHCGLRAPPPLLSRDRSLLPLPLLPSTRSTALTFSRRRRSITELDERTSPCPLIRSRRNTEWINTRDAADG